MRLSLLAIYTDANDVSMNFKLSTTNQGWFVSVHRVVGTPPGAYSCGNLWREKSSDRLPVIFALHRAAASAPRCRARVWGGVFLVVYAFFTTGMLQLAHGCAPGRPVTGCGWRAVAAACTPSPLSSTSSASLGSARGLLRRRLLVHSTGSWPRQGRPLSRPSPCGRQAARYSLPAVLNVWSPLSRLVMHS